jgi:hypothetical protein
VNEEQLRRLLDQASSTAWDDDVRAQSALFAGQRRVRTRRSREVVVGALVVMVAGAAGLVALIPASSTPSTDVVLGCASGAGTGGQDGLVNGGVGGVTLSVHNPTSELQSVTAGAVSVLAVPGTSQVTLPLRAGRSTVRCGSGAPVRLTVQHLSAQSDCTSLDTSLDGLVERGKVDALTLARVGALPADAIVSTSSSDPLQRVQVRAQGRVVAEAVWHELPGQDDWQLESLSRCR